MSENTPPRVTRQMLQVLAAMLERPSEEFYGMELIGKTGLKSGTLYPVLARLERTNWLTSNWETTDPKAAGRPRRRFYRLTAEGEPAARRELNRARAELAPTPTPKTLPGAA
jgi:PadR family transcriptional regulator, regulatory protein PadR